MNENYEINPLLKQRIAKLNKFILNKNSNVTTEELTLFLINDKTILKYECKKCKNDGMWQTKPMTLILDRLNNLLIDNRLENLRFLCPNCYSQLKKKKILFNKIVKENERYCVDCNKRILAKTKTYNGLKSKVIRCKKCIDKNINNPHDEDEIKFV